MSEFPSRPSVPLLEQYMTAGVSFDNALRAWAKALDQWIVDVFSIVPENFVNRVDSLERLVGRLDGYVANMVSLVYKDQTGDTPAKPAEHGKHVHVTFMKHDDSLRRVRAMIRDLILADNDSRELPKPGEYRLALTDKTLSLFITNAFGDYVELDTFDIVVD